jgi:hypothetical protein
LSFRVSRMPDFMPDVSHTRWGRLAVLKRLRQERRFLIPTSIKINKLSDDDGIPGYPG